MILTPKMKKTNKTMCKVAQGKTNLIVILVKHNLSIKTNNKLIRKKLSNSMKKNKNRRKEEWN